MLHLAQVRKSKEHSCLELQLLAYQKPNQSWSICHPETVIVDNYQFLNEGILVLVELNQNKDIINIKEAKEWILNIIKTYLCQQQVTPEFLQTEKDKIEAWKQELTTQSQALTQKSLEVETRLEQLQELEKNFAKMNKSDY